MPGLIKGSIHRLNPHACASQAAQTAAWPSLSGVSLRRCATSRGYNWVGFASAENGIGQSQRNLMTAAAAAGEDISSLDISYLCPARDGDKSWRHLPSEPVRGRRTIFHFNPPETGHVIKSLGKGIFQDGYNIAYWSWELPELPDEWTHFARLYRELWVPSTFIAEAVRAKSDVPVRVVPNTISIPSQPKATDRLAARVELGLPTDAYLFGMVFDLNSTVERKNPLGAMRAFHEHFRDDDGAYLVVKINGSSGRQTMRSPLVEPLIEYLRDDRILLIDEIWTRERTDCFFDAIDCLVNLHRAEGFGLTLAEAMARGKPVIATDWSGNRDFFDASNGFPVAYTLIEIDRPHGPYLPGNTWAEPSVAHAGEQMRRCLDDAAEARHRAEKARRDIEQGFSPRALAPQLKTS